jgi:spermidine synthase
VRRGLVVAGAVFVSGAVVLGMEIAASRVLAPFFGNSLFVWGALIGVVLAGLALGYWAGGWLADRIPTPSLLAGVMGLGALLVLAIPVLDEPVLEAIVEWDPGPRLNPLIAAIALFGLPSLVLAGVAPTAVRLRARSLTTLGQTAGRLFAISTAGSIAGTFATAFWLIPEFGTDQLLGLAAAALFAAATLVALSERLLVLAGLVAAGVALSTYAAVELAPQTGGTLSEAQATNWSPLYRRVGYVRGQEVERGGAGLTLRYAKDTRYHRLSVTDSDTTRYLRFDNSFQSGMVLDRPFGTAFEYTELFHLLKAYNPDARDVLFIGLGGGSSPKRLWRDFPDLRLQGVELDPVVVDVAYRFFELPRDPRLKVAVDDGRRYLARNDRKWDAILIDAFFSDAIPFHLFTTEFMEIVKSRLNPGGVIVTNTIGSITGPQSRLFRSIYRTYRSVLPTVLVHPTYIGARDDTGLLNLILVASDGAAPSKAFLAERWRQVRAESPQAPDLLRRIADRDDRPISLEGVPTLTDQYAPTDALLLIE